MTTDVPRGLAGVIAGKTAISSIDGEAGELLYRGYTIESLAEHATSLDVAGLLIDGELPDEATKRSLESALSRRELSPLVAKVLSSIDPGTHPMRVLQAVLPLLADEVDRAEARVRNRAAQRRILLALLAQLPTVLASWLAMRRGERPTSPDPRAPLWHDFLRTVRGGAAPSEGEAKLLDLVQMLQMEHGWNASTFAVRVVASTQATLHASLAAGVGALSGPLHGGADEAAYRMATTIGAPTDAAAWVEAALDRGEKIMGLGHREYRVVDPRAVILQREARRVRSSDDARRVLDVLAEVESAAERRFSKSGKRIRANVEFWKGAVFASLGIPTDAFTSMFTLARAFGWGAHALEEWDDSALIRPQALYVGEPRREVDAPRG